MTTYVCLLLVPLLIVLFFDQMVGKKLLMKRDFWIIVGIFLGAMLIFDTYLTALPIVIYNADKISGLFVGTIPVEDFIYGFTLLITVLSLPSFFSFGKKDWKTIMLSSRPFSWINTAYPAALAVFLTRGYFVREDVLVIFYFLLPYNLLVYGVNDIYDYDTDIKNPRKRTIEGAVLPKHLHRLMLFLSIGLSLLFLPLFTSSLSLLILYSVMICMALIYSIPPFRTKTKPVLDSITSSLHFVLPAVVGMASVEGIARFHPVLLSFFIWGVASHMLGAIPDIFFDKKAGMRTIATFLGEAKTLYLVFFGYVLSATVLYLQGLPYFLLGTAVGVYSFLPIWALLDANVIPTLFRKFMYYNLFVGFIITITVIMTMVWH